MAILVIDEAHWPLLGAPVALCIQNLMYIILMGYLGNTFIPILQMKRLRLRI